MNFDTILKGIGETWASVVPVSVVARDEEWRMLQDGEVMREGDEYDTPNVRGGEGWRPIPSGSHGGKFKGSWATACPVRRRI